MYAQVLQRALLFTWHYPPSPVAQSSPLGACQARQDTHAGPVVPTQLPHSKATSKAGSVVDGGGVLRKKNNKKTCLSLS